MIRSLIVDDELVSREKLRIVMSRYGACECVADAASAVKAFVSAWNDWAPFDLLTMDIGLPDKNGVELLKAIRQLEQSHNVGERHRARVIMVTSSAERALVEQCVQAGCNDYIVKPVNAATICAKLEGMSLK
jgi:two-component system chemotaxis response regulator CheY